MSFFGDKKNQNNDLAVLLDITSNTVAIGLIESGGKVELLKMHWSHTELVSTAADTASKEKRLMVAIFNAFNELAGSGLKSLRKVGIDQLPKIIQVTISAPYAYTISRNVFLQTEEPIKVTRLLINELENKAVDEITRHANSDLVSKNLQLVMLSNSTASLAINGYPMLYPFASMASQINLCQVVALGEKKLVDHIEKCRDKFFPEVILDIDSFLSPYLRVINKLAPKSSDLCLIAISDEITELLVQRDSLPQSSSFIFNEGSGGTYQENLVKLFTRTEDGLSLPKNIYFHNTSKQSEQDLARLLQSSSRTATGTNHQVFSVNTSFFSRMKFAEVRFSCLAYVYHERLYQDRHLADVEDMLK